MKKVMFVTLLVIAYSTLLESQTLSKVAAPYDLAPLQIGHRYVFDGYKLDDSGKPIPSQKYLATDTVVRMEGLAGRNIYVGVDSVWYTDGSIPEVDSARLGKDSEGNLLIWVLETGVRISRSGVLDTFVVAIRPSSPVGVPYDVVKFDETGTFTFYPYRTSTVSYTLTGRLKVDIKMVNYGPDSVLVPLKASKLLAQKFASNINASFTPIGIPEVPLIVNRNDTLWLADGIGAVKTKTPKYQQFGSSLALGWISGDERDLRWINFPVSAPTLSSPPNGSVGVAIKPNLSWNGPLGASSYRVQVSVDPTFAAPVVDTSGITSASVSVLTTLGKNALYYWRVSAGNWGGTSGWSDVWSFTTVPPGPPTPALIYPLDNALDVGTSPTFTWSISVSATSYRLQVDTSKTFTTTAYDQLGLLGSSQLVQGLKKSTPHYWRVNASNASGTSLWSTVWKFTTGVTTTVEQVGNEIPTQYSLSLNYPNPFNPTTKIQFDIPKPGFAMLKVFSLLGREVSALVAENLPAGRYVANWNASEVPSGVYFYRLQVGDFVQVRKMLLVR
jgi:hypothetical protein